MAEFLALTADQLPDLMETLKDYFPDTMPIYYTADNTVRRRLTLEEVQFYVDTWPSPTCVVLVSPAQKGQLSNYRTTVDVWTKDTEVLIKFLKDNTILDWSQPIFFRVQHLSDTELASVQETLEGKGGTCNCVERHISILDTPPQDIISPPEGYTLVPKLSATDAETVGREYSAWGVDPLHTISYFQHCSARLSSSGVHTDSAQLVAYAVPHHTSALGSVVTSSEHQRKGLGTVVVTEVCRQMNKDGQTPCVFVNPDNTASAGLYKKCGFQSRAKAFRIRYVPNRRKVCSKMAV